MIPVFSIVGASKSGKTTLIEKVVGELKNRGFNVAVIKHDVHGFEIDHKGRDTYRIREAGADITIISSPEKLAMVERRKNEADIEEIISRCTDEVDIIITEGYKSHSFPKVEVKKEGEEIITKGDENLLAVVSDEKIDLKIPVIKRNNYLKIVELIENIIYEEDKQDLELFVNNKNIPLKSFIHTMFVEIIKGMLKSLKGLEAPKKIIIKLKPKN